MSKPIPFVGSPGQRDTSTTDQRFVNVLFEVEKEASPGQYPVNCIKRPGLSTSTRPTGGTAVGRGVYYWAGTGNIYSVFDGDIYSNVTKMTSTASLSTSTVAGRVWFAETHQDTGQRKLLICDGLDNYEVTSTNVITQIDQVDDGQYPTTNLGSLVFMDGYLFQGQSDGKIWNTDINTTSSWTATSYLTADTFGGDLEAIHIQKNQIIAFTKNRIEFFFNNGNPTGSPLLRIDQNTLGFGLAHKNSLASSGETACFVSENAANGDGGRSVYIIASLTKVKEISNPSLNRLLTAEGLSVSSCTAWMERVAGQMVYCLNLALANRSFVYSVDSGLWKEWANTVSTRFNGISATSKDGIVYVQDVSSGYIHTLIPSVYQDAGTNFTVMLQTARSNYGSPLRKYATELSVIGDTSTGNLGVAVSDDDYASFGTARNIDMSAQLKRLTRMGAFYSRAYRFTYTANAPMRLQAYVPEVTVGTG